MSIFSQHIASTSLTRNSGSETQQADLQFIELDTEFVKAVEMSGSILLCWCLDLF